MREHSHSAVKDDTDVSGRVGRINCIISKTKWCQKRYRTELQVRVSSVLSLFSFSLLRDIHLSKSDKQSYILAMVLANSRSLFGEKDMYN